MHELIILGIWGIIIGGVLFLGQFILMVLFWAGAIIYSIGYWIYRGVKWLLGSREPLLIISVVVLLGIGGIWGYVTIHTAPTTPICPQQLPQVQHDIPSPTTC